MESLNSAGGFGIHSQPPAASKAPSSVSHSEHPPCQLQQNIYGAVDRKSTEPEEGMKRPQDISLCSCQKEAAHQK